MNVPPEALYALLFLAFALEGTSLPVPAELLALAAGPHLASGRLSFGLTVMAAALGHTVGALLAYAAGSAWARRAHDHPGADGRPGLARLRRWAPLLVFGARWFGFIRPLALLGAGAVRIPLGAYAAVSLLAGLAYCALWLWVSWRFADVARRWLPASLWGNALAGLAGLLAGWALLRRLLRAPRGPVPGDGLLPPGTRPPGDAAGSARERSPERRYGAG